jgi:methyl-accepting chemotaxis protein
MATVRQSGGGPIQILFSPAIWLMNRLRYAPKFVLIGVLLLIPFAVVARLQFKGTTENLAFNEYEHYGVEYIAATRDLLKAVERHRLLMSAVLSGQASYRAEMADTARSTDALVAAIDAVEVKEGLDGTYGTMLKTTDKWKATKDEWGMVRGSQFTSAAASEAAHDKVTGMLVDLITNTAGNYSNLILDPDLDSYFLMDAWNIKLPQLAEGIDKASLLAMRGINKGSLTADERAELIGHMSLLDARMNGDLIETDMKTAFAENKSNEKAGFKKFGVMIDPELNARATKAQQKMRELLTFLQERFVSADRISATVPELRQRAVEASDEVYSVYQKVGPELDKLIMARVRDYAQKRRTGVLASIAGAVLLIYIFSGLYFGVRNSVNYLGEATRRMVTGTTERFAVDSRDELGEIAGSYNVINAALVESRDLRSRIEKENQELQENILGLLRVVSEAADGDLTVRAKVTAGSLGSVADAFNQMLESWAHLLGDIQKLFNLTTDAIGKIQHSSESMAAGATQQVQGITGANASVRRMAEDIQRVSKNAETAAVAAKRAQESALSGSDTVQNVVRGMEGLRANVQAGAKKIKNLGDRSMEITSIVGTIARISEQTNMLALNAAIEAARAGEHGRGFSVVADQVRQLAERTATATQEIEGLVRQIQAETNESVEAIEQQTEVVENESQVVGRAGEVLLQIREVSTQSAELVADISAISKAQVEGAMGVAGVMDQISQIATQTKKGADDSVRFTKELAGLSGKLQESVNKFQLGNGAAR